MAFLNLALEKKFGKDFDREDPEVKEFIENFNKRKLDLYKTNVFIISTSVSWMDFHEGMVVKFKGASAIVKRIDFRDIDDYEIYLTLNNGEEAVVTAEECDTYYYFDDFFTRPTDELLTNFGFEKIREKVEESGRSEMITIKETWKYKGNHPATKLPDYWFLYLFATKVSNSPAEKTLGETRLAEYKCSFYCGMESQGQYNSSQVGMEHIEYLLNKSAISHKPLRQKYNGDDIIITDPCYIFDYEERDLKRTLGISSTTLYGDWSCTVFEEKTKKVLGNFCADAGDVGVYKLKDILRLHPNWDVDREVNHGSATLIKDFTGEVIIEYIPPTDELNIFDEGYVRVVGKGNINFFSSQTGL